MAVLTPSARVQLSAALRDAAQAKLAASLLAWARDDLAFTAEEVAEMLGASHRSVMRWAAAEVAPSSEYRDRIEKLSELRHLLESVFRDAKSRIAWMNSPLPILRGRTPVTALRRNAWDEVLGVLAGLESGAFG
jgi:uncharacterized protein (DUF2384 family)